MHPKFVPVFGQNILLVYNVMDRASYDNISNWLLDIKQVIDWLHRHCWLAHTVSVDWLTLLVLIGCIAIVGWLTPLVLVGSHR